AVIVDNAVKSEKGSSGDLVRKTIPRSADELKKIRDLVIAAVGVDVARGDLLTVENVSFDTQPNLDDTKLTFYEKWKDLIRPALRYGSFFILFLLIYWLVLRPVSKTVLTPIQQAFKPQPEQKEIAGSEEVPPSLEPLRTVRELEAALSQDEGSSLVPKVDVRKADILKRRITDFIQREPENGAQLLRAWLTEEGKS